MSFVRSLFTAMLSVLLFYLIAHTLPGVDVFDPISNALNEINVTDIYYSGIRDEQPVPNDRIVLVDIADMGRGKIADAVGNVCREGAATVGIDMIFDRHNPDTAANRALTDTLKKYQASIINGARLYCFNDKSGKYECEATEIPGFNPAFVNLSTEGEQSYIRHYMVQPEGETPSFAQAVARHYLNAYDLPFEATETDEGVIDFTPQTFVTVNAVDSAAISNTVPGAIVIIGDINSPEDRHFTPTGQRGGAEIHAYTIDTLLRMPTATISERFAWCLCFLVLLLTSYGFVMLRKKFEDRTPQSQPFAYALLGLCNIIYPVTAILIVMFLIGLLFFTTAIAISPLIFAGSLALIPPSYDILELTIALLRKRAAIIIALLATAASANADTVYGVVFDRNDKSKFPELPGVTVIIKSANQETFTCTNIDGAFAIENVKPGSVFEISYVGFTRVKVTYEGYNITKIGRDGLAVRLFNTAISPDKAILAKNIIEHQKKPTVQAKSVYNKANQKAAEISMQELAKYINDKEFQKKSQKKMQEFVKTPASSKSHAQTKPQTNPQPQPQTAPVKFAFRTPQTSRFTNPDVTISFSTNSQSARYVISGESKQHALTAADLSRGKANITLPKRDCDLTLADEAGNLHTIHFVYDDSADRQRNSTLHILAIGLDNYKADNLNNLSYAEADAKAVCNAMARKHSGTFAKINAKTLTGNLVTAPRIEAEINNMADEAKPNDLAVIFFAGHGLVDGLKNYYLATSEVTDATTPRKGGLSAESFAGKLRYIQCKTLVFIDACYSGKILESFRSADISNRDFFKELNSTPNGMNIYTSSGSEVMSRELPQYGHGIFTQALLESFEFKNSDTDSDGRITVKEIRNYLEARIMKLSRNQQTPLHRNIEEIGDYSLFMR